MNNNLSVLKQLNMMILLTIITQVIILVKNAVVASYFGISAEMDAFNLANRISTFIYSFIGAGISTVIIPYLKDKINKKSINIFISVIYTAGFLLLISMVIFRKEIILITGGLNDNYFIDLSANILIFTAITGFINAMIQLAKGLLEFNDKFNIEKIIVLISNILLVIMLILGENNLYYYATILLFTAIINLIFHAIFVKKTKFKYTINYDLNDNSFKEMMKLYFPVMLSTGVYQISLLIDTLIAARLSVGSISSLNYANTVISMINLLLLGNITSFFYPKLVKKNNNKERQESLANYILLVNALMGLIIVLFFTIGKDGISILFERGKFTSEDTAIVFIIALILSLSLPTNGIRDLLYRYFYMNKDTLTPFINSIIISVLNILISVVLAKYIGLYGVVLGTVLSTYFSLLFICIKFKKIFPIYLSLKKFIVENSKIILIAGLSVLSSMILKNTFDIDNTFLGVIVYSLFSLIIYVIFLKVFKSKIFKMKL